MLYGAPVHLKTEGRVNPLGMDVARPAFAWQSDATERDWSQSAYEVMVASAPGMLQTGKADVWDSGKRASSESVGIGYEGPELKAHERYYWTVRVWDKQGKSAMAGEAAWWEMGLLQPADWQASWIRRDDPVAAAELRSIHWIWMPGTDAQHVPQGTSTTFAYTLHLAAKPEAASLHIFSGGTFTAKVNGQETGHKKEWGAFDREEIRDQLVYGAGAAGDNTIEVTVAVQKTDKAGETFPAALAAVLRIKGADGAMRSLVSDGSWRVRQDGAGATQAAQDLGPLLEHHFGVAPDRVSPGVTPDRVESSASLFRKDFTPRGKVVSARLYVTALGAYEAFLNGKKIGQNELTPGFTDFRKRVLYQTYDVTGMVGSGGNTLAAMVGAGWFGSPLLWSGTREFPGPELLKAQLELRYADGTSQIVGTDASWQTAAAPVVASEIYGGEAYDARLKL